MERFLDSSAMTSTGYCPQWIATRSARRPMLERARQAFGMNATREDKLRLASVVTNCVLGGVLLWATWSTKTITSHETRLSNQEAWRSEKAPLMESLVREQAEMKTRLALIQEQFRMTDVVVREVSAKVTVMTEALIRIQEAQGALKEKLTTLQVKRDQAEETK